MIKKKIILLILIVSLFAIATVSASENATEDVIRVDSNSCCDDLEILTAKDNNTILTQSSEKYSLKDTNSSTNQITQNKTEHKTFYVGQMKFPKKYNKYAAGLKPSKKNKKAWKNYKAYKKMEKKQLKKFQKQCFNIMLKETFNNWNFDTDSTSAKMKYRGKYVYLKYYCKAYKVVQ